MAEIPADTTPSLADRIFPHRPKPATPETIIQYDTLLVLPDERIVSLDYDRGRLDFLSDSAKKYIYRLPRSTYTFSVRPRGPGFFVKYKKALWRRRFVVGALYPLDAFARADISFGHLFLQGEVTTKNWRVGLGWQIF